MMTYQTRKYYLGPANGYLRIRILLNGNSRAHPLYSGFMEYVSAHSTIDSLMTKRIIAGSGKTILV